MSTTIKNMQDVQLQMITVIQEIQKKVNEMHTSLVSADNTKWVEDAIDHEIFGLIEEVKCLSDKDFMKVTYLE
ncbi:6961_t:CDS:2 [Gigaspora margarita]|uniref:6961_t:CDS:1 n=1 Tax=Gigaspora margarita TaxID=4874 RepID=A0ABM8VX77_GIGMA|nr:6961_t:CDS:2 [Gigaspora margarita]